MRRYGKQQFEQSLIYEPLHEISNNGVCVTSKASYQPAHTRNLIRALASRLPILRVEHHKKFLGLKGGCTGSSESSNGCHYGPIFFKPEKNLEFFRQKIGP